MTPATALQAPATPRVQDIRGDLEQMIRHLEAFKGERSELLRQLPRASGPDAAIIREKIAAVDGQIAQLQGQFGQVVGDLARAKVEEALGKRLVAGAPAPPVLPGRPLIDPDAFAWVFVLFSVGVIVPLSVGLTRRLWRRPAPPPPRTPDLEAMARARFDRLEQAVDAIAIEVERISEGQRFVTRLLNERPSIVRPAPSADANESAALGEATPFLALGAGSRAPIPIVQRQGVKQSITPH